jgi:curved DNA-binding protein CbpA
MREPRPDPYRVLGVCRDATAADITRAHRLQARAVHPDTAPPGTGTAAQFRALSDAYHVLSDPARRAAHDRARSRDTAAGPGQAAPGRTRPRPAAGPPPASPRVPPGPVPARMPALRAGPVRVEPLPATAPGSGPGAGSQAGADARAGPVRWHPGTRRDGL